jgi:glutamate synthase (NADPH/NADH) small chain
MGKTTGFKEWQRSEAPKRPKDTRVGDWNEFYLERDPDVSRQQGGRCMDCGVPFCQQGCPLGNQIPDWNDLVFRDRWHDAITRLHATNNFPEFTGRLCPAPCEAACVLAINDDPVTIEQIEKEIAERAFAEGWVTPRTPRPSSGKSVGVVGSGPAGLAAAEQLALAGHAVTVYEKADRIGGLLRYGIPDFKMEKWVIDRRLAILEAEGVRFETGVAAGTDVSWADLRARHDALLIATGAEKPRDLPVPGRELDGVHFAMEYLTQQNRRVAGLPVEGPAIDAKGKSVVVLGGGDTGSDCLGTAHRQGAAAVWQIELLPQPPEARPEDNPWPQWPMVMRTSTSQAEGGQREFAVMTKRLLGEGGRVEALEAVRLEFGTGGNGARPTMVEVEGSTFTIAADLVLLAMGFLGPVTDSLVEQLGVAVTPRGNVAVDARYETSVPGVFATGDASRGQSLIVWAISDGREAARHIDASLQPERAWLPSRGADQPFGGR